jgi:FkbM family methyltransferase
MSRPVVSSDKRLRKPKTGPLRIQRLQEEAERLSLKARLQLIDLLKPGMTAKSKDGVRYSLRSTSEYKRFRKPKPWDESIAQWIASFKPSDVFYDVGANTGSLSLLAAIVHEGRVPVVAIEPGFETFEALVRNVLLNDLTGVVIPLQVALFDESAVRPFHYHTLGAGSALHAIGQPIDHTRRRFEPAAVQPVLAFRLDDLVRWFQLPSPTRIKLDVDGFESKVLAGASQTLKAGRCELCIELTETEKGDPHPGQLLDSLRPLGFEVVKRVDHTRGAETYPRSFDVFLTGRRAKL